MKLTKCESGHFYDGDKFPACPYCNSELQKDNGSIVAAGGTPVENAAPGQAFGPVSGWLVVMSGAGRGRDLRLGEGRTFIGVDAEKAPMVLSATAPLDVRLAAVVFDPKTGEFSVVPGSSQELIYLNGKAVLAPTPLTETDKLTVGKSELRFVPFCKDGFLWATPQLHQTKQEKADKQNQQQPKQQDKQDKQNQQQPKKK